MSIPNWIVTEVIPHKNFTLQLSFADGTEKIVDINKILDKSIFAPLKNPDLLMKAKVECGSVVWNDDIDIAPEWHYEA